MTAQTSGDYAENQVEIAPAFVALYCDKAGRLLLAEDQLRLRYEICEDLVQHLAGPALAMLGAGGDAKSGAGIEIQRRIFKGLLAGESGLDQHEAGWVMQRLAELLEWPALDEVDLASCRASPG
jgi:hypothetical protein